MCVCVSVWKQLNHWLLNFFILKGDIPYKRTFETRDTSYDVLSYDHMKDFLFY